MKEGELRKAQREREVRLGKLDSKLSSSKEEARPAQRPFRVSVYARSE